MNGDTPAFESPDAAVKHYQKLCDALQSQLSDANADIHDFTESSRELQEELEKELATMEASEKSMRKGLDEARGEMEDWKSKYTATLRDHTNTMTHMQRELESLRASEKALRTKLRDMELDNDDLEKSEREKDSSLQDFETRYGKSLERIALLEEELVNKAQLEEEAQRLRDELRDLNEEMSVMKSQARTYPPAYPRPLTPPGPTPKARPLSASPSPPPSPTPKTPRLRPDSNVGPPVIALVGATPMRPAAPSPPKSPTRPPPVAAHRAAVTPLSRSTKALNLASAAISTPPLNGNARATTTPKAVRERRTDGVIKDMKEMTDRVRLLTQRLDSRRNLVMAGSSIPRASPQRLGMSTRVSDRKLDVLGESTTASSIRPPSRSGLRMSMGGHQNSTGIPVRPPSRLSLSTTSSRSSTPTPRRSPTPSSVAPSIASRPGWGSSAPATPGNSLAASVRRRTSSTYGVAVPPLPTNAGRRSADLSATITAGSGARRSTEMLKAEQAALGVSVNGGNPRDGIARRASLALGRSVLRRPSASNGS